MAVLIHQQKLVNSPNLDDITHTN